MKNTKFTKTVYINAISPLALQLGGMQIGQWFKCNETGIRGQYLGSTSTGDIVHWIKGENAKFNTRFAKGNKLLRDYAKLNSGY